MGEVWLLASLPAKANYGGGNRPVHKYLRAVPPSSLLACGYSMRARDAWRSRWPPQAISRAEQRILVLPTPRLPAIRHLCREYGFAMRNVWIARAALPQLPGGSSGIGVCKRGELAHEVNDGCADAGMVVWQWAGPSAC